MDARRRWGWAWIALCGALAVHVADEALTDFLSVYNPAVRAIRERVPFLPLPVFTFEVWLAGLIVAVVVLLLLSRPVFRGARWMRPASYVFAGLMTLNGLLHFAGSFWLGRPMPGVWSAPLLLAASFFLFRATRAAARPERGPTSSEAGPLQGGRMRTTLTLCCLLLLCRPPLGGQGTTGPLAQLPVGARVRVSAPTVLEFGLKGSVWATSPDTFYLAASGEISHAVPLHAIERLEVSQGWTQAALVGAGVGAFALGTLGYYASTVGDRPDPGSQQRTAEIGAFAMAGALPGALAGALLGERWRQVFP